MEIYNETGKTKSTEQRITRPVGALLIGSDKKLSELTTEKITMYIERASGNNVEIGTNINLKRAILLGVFGISMVNGSNGFEAIMPIAYGGAIPLGDGESIKFALDLLNAAKIYNVNGLEMPMVATGLVKLEEKVILTDEISRKLDVAGHELACIEGIDEITEMSLSFANGSTVKYTQKELKALAFDEDPVIGSVVGVDTELGLIHNLTNIIVLPLTEVLTLDITKGNANPVNITLKNADAEL